MPLQYASRADRAPVHEVLAMSFKLLPLLGAVVLAAPAHAVSINMSDFSFAS